MINEYPAITIVILSSKKVKFLSTPLPCIFHPSPRFIHTLHIFLDGAHLNISYATAIDVLWAKCGADSC